MFQILILVAIGYFASRYLRRPELFQHIDGPKPQSWVMGNLGQLFAAKGLPFHQGLVDRFGRMVKVYGFFGDEQLYISDSMAIRAILGKYQDAFDETSVFLETNKVIFGPGLVATSGEQHKRQRRLVAPLFSVTQLKALMPVFYDVSHRLVDVFEREFHDSEHGKESKKVLDLSEWMSRVALEMIGQTVLGYSFDPLSGPHNNPYTSAIKELIPTLFSLSLVRQFAPVLAHIGPPSFRRWVIERVPHDAVQKIVGMSDVMDNTAKSILAGKRHELDERLEQGESDSRDLISVLLRANEKASEQDKMSEMELTGQITVLVFGAQDTTSSALSRILYLLAERQDIQDRVREELNTAGAGKRDRLGYDQLIALPWLDAVIRESLRLYPPVPFVRRTAVKPCSLLYVSQKKEEEVGYVHVPAGTTLFVSIIGFNRLEDIWGEDAKKWKPERWLKRQFAEDLRLGIYHGMLSFLAGNRSCVGYKFAQVEMKVLLSTLLTNFRFRLTDADVVWNLSQIISPSVLMEGKETKGMPLKVERV